MNSIFPMCEQFLHAKAPSYSLFTERLQRSSHYALRITPYAFSLLTAIVDVFCKVEEEVVVEGLGNFMEQTGIDCGSREDVIYITTVAMYLRSEPGDGVSPWH